MLKNAWDVVSGYKYGKRNKNEHEQYMIGKRCECVQK